jgi:hypothetical protein
VTALLQAPPHGYFGPNISTTFFNSTIETSNSFLALDDEEGIQDSICKPSHHCSPIHIISADAKNTAGYNVNKSITS